MEYILHVIIMLNIYILLVLSANLPIGMANLLTMCQAAFYGIGAYISAFFSDAVRLAFYRGHTYCHDPYGAVQLRGIFRICQVKGRLFHSRHARVSDDRVHSIV